MKKVKKTLFCFLWRENHGATMAEYGLLVLLIAVVVIAGATALGNAINGLYNQVAASF